MSPDAIKDYEDKLNKTIDLYNRLVTSHSAANSKMGLNSVKSTQKASARLLKDIRTYLQKCADEKLVQDVKASLNYDQNMRAPDGAIAAALYNNGIQFQDSQLPSDAAVSQMENNEPGAAQTPLVRPLVPASETVIQGRMNSPPRFSFQVEVQLVPQMLSSSSNPSTTPQDPQLPSTRGHETTSGEDNVPLIDLGSTRISEVVPYPQCDNS
ncbi:hypothetical protein DL96DRAFT_1562840 [Flagelloscypha sp. PMI_526]|nr:hypothetical protein DL96DRAFT_1562840 [Flagelloscypha sp. PMI_526]